MNKLLILCGVRVALRERFAFLGWQNTTTQERYHDSPGFFENEWAAGRVPNAPQYPLGLFDIYEATPPGGGRVLTVVHDPKRLGQQDVLRLLKEVGLACKPL